MANVGLRFRDDRQGYDVLCDHEPVGSVMRPGWEEGFKIGDGYAHGSPQFWHGFLGEPHCKGDACNGPTRRETVSVLIRIHNDGAER